MAKQTRPKKHIVVFSVMALLGTNMEIAARVGDLVKYPEMRLKDASLAGWTSLWMLPIYGVAGLALGQLNEWERIRRKPMLLQCLIALAIAWAIELASGCLLNLHWGLGVWDYSDRMFNYKGQICLHTGMQFFLIAPLVFWADDLVRFLVYGEKRPDVLVSYYRALFLLQPARRRHPHALPFATLPLDAQPFAPPPSEAPSPFQTPPPHQTQSPLEAPPPLQTPPRETPP